MKKTELKRRLLTGEKLCDILPLRSGQECEIFKADSFMAGDDILYIPDVYLNELCYAYAATPYEVGRILHCCYTGEDFINECGGNVKKAKRLFEYCDWQHPSSALPEIEDEAEIAETEYGELRCALCNELLLCDECGDMPEECPNCGATLVYPASIGGANSET